MSNNKEHYLTLTCLDGEFPIFTIPAGLVVRVGQGRLPAEEGSDVPGTVTTAVSLGTGEVIAVKESPKDVVRMLEGKKV